MTKNVKVSLGFARSVLGERRTCDAGPSKHRLRQLEVVPGGILRWLVGEFDGIS